LSARIIGELVFNKRAELVRQRCTTLKLLERLRRQRLRACVAADDWLKSDFELMIVRVNAIAFVPFLRVVGQKLIEDRDSAQAVKSVGQRIEPSTRCVCKTIGFVRNIRNRVIAVRRNENGENRAVQACADKLHNSTAARAIFYC
jgi:hypothetical protein